MNSAICKMLGIELPILAFSHCRDVVAEVSKAGGMGVFGVARSSPEELEEELSWIDEHVGGKPYGVDILMPTVFDEHAKPTPSGRESLPAAQVEFVRKVLDEAGIPRLPDDQAAEMAARNLDSINLMPGEGLKMLEIAFRHPIKLIVNALGTPPADLIERAHVNDIRIAALAGNAKHAIRHRDAGCDFVIAVGHEAGGHTGQIGSMVLWPQIVDAVAPLPVLGAGGVGRGRQVAAALALGCAGVWCGSIWLNTVQSEVAPEIKRRFTEAQSSDSVWTKAFTGKSCRILRGGYTEAWNRPDAPPTLPAFAQRYLWETEARSRIERSHRSDFALYPVGQLVGDMGEETSVRSIIMGMLDELVESKQRFDELLDF